MNVLSTRNMNHKIPATQAVLQGISPDGGLFVPEFFPSIDIEYAAMMAKEGYAQLCAYVLGLFFDIEKSNLQALSKEAYAGFDAREVVPVVKLSENEFVMELTHGPTLAFKDMALQVLPRLLEYSMVQHSQAEDVLILTATSGDTGKAALEGFKDVPKTAIFVFYPEDGVADMQKLQMVTQAGQNTGVCSVKGNFDDAQTGVKKLFADEGFRAQAKEAGFTLSSANSINIGRLVPQIAYYIYTYVKLVNDTEIRMREEINFVVPTGNFGNILAAYYAKRMGLNIAKLICASNKNNILTDFFNKGEYDTNRTFHKTMSPSMDILISSNLERLVFEMTGRDDKKVCEFMKALKNNGEYRIPVQMKAELQKLFYADCATEEQTAETIRSTFKEHGYLMDTHTAVAQSVYDRYTELSGDDHKTVVVSTANPYKFTQDVLLSLTGENEPDAFLAAEKLHMASRTKVPRQIGGLKKLPVLHNKSANVEGMKEAVLEFIAKRR